MDKYAIQQALPYTPQAQVVKCSVSIVLTLARNKHLTLLRLHTITVLPLTTVYIVSEFLCTLNVLRYYTLAITYIYSIREFTHYNKK